MSRFLLLNFKDFGLNQDITQTIQPQTLVCICCLDRNVPFINLTTCKHSTFLDIFSVPELEVEKKVICYQCHGMLMKIDTFKMQVLQSFKVLTENNLNTPENENPRMNTFEKQQIVNIYLPPVKSGRNCHSEPEKPSTNQKPLPEETTSGTENEIPLLPVINIRDAAEPNVSSPAPNNKEAESKEPPAVPVVKTKEKLKRNSSGMSVINIKREPLELEIDFIPNVKGKTQENKEPEQTNQTDSHSTKVKMVTLTKDELMEERAREETSQSFLRFPHRCHLCLVGFNYKENIEDHMKRKHGPKVGSLTCEVCLAVLYPPGSINVHMYRHFTRYECLSCRRRYLSFDECLHHYNREHALHRCDKCPYTTEYAKKLKYHESIRHNFKCKECAVVFDSTPKLRQHMASSHRMHKCSRCPAAFPSPAQLREHTRAHRPRGAAHATRGRRARTALPLPGGNR